MTRRNRRSTFRKVRWLLASCGDRGVNTAAGTLTTSFPLGRNEQAGSGATVTLVRARR